eukprot:7327695-Prymnesium_polylepis.1
MRRHMRHGRVRVWGVAHARLVGVHSPRSLVVCAWVARARAAVARCPMSLRQWPHQLSTSRAAAGPAPYPGGIGRRAAAEGGAPSV